jgi:dTDP-4-amino-4,6-dideoxygalactose transaminase
VPWYEHAEIGFNYRMGNLNAAVGRGQLRTLPDRIAERRRVRTGYERHLGRLPGVSFQQAGEGCEPNHWLTTIRVDPAVFGSTPGDIVAALREEGVEARHGFKPMHLQPVFEGAPVVGGAVADDLFATTVSLPSGARLTDEQVEWISGVVASLSA